MSAKNTKKNKVLRRLQRETSPASRAERVPVSDIPHGVLTNLLLENRRNGRSRREALLLVSGSFVKLPTTPKRDIAVKHLLKLQTLSLVKLIRERQRTARRASSCMYRAQVATLGSKIREQWEGIQHNLLAYLKQVNAEIQVRTSHT